MDFNITAPTVGSSPALSTLTPDNRRVQVDARMVTQTMQPLTNMWWTAGFVKTALHDMHANYADSIRPASCLSFVKAVS
ncbi:hypothetical protein GCM10017044_08980 [Kordiimonas sediminis]|uniref:Uncharacterized protein n=1 Tax=Kordiimonas sediminis TaxID=1735581 RepID=A0A919APF2_9PROT|nr:hypothetical protein [Kordiimonas sediminis]GHF16831.1 hypothetical protein GCM10017044_08980 [Kordiimonas sediminis]